MTHIARLLATVGLLFAGAQAWGAINGEPASEAGLGSDSRMHELPFEASLLTIEPYLGPVAENDFYGGFADFDDDGRKDLLIAVDNDKTCDDNVCDFFVFAPVVKDRQLVKACDWHLVDDRRKPITREAGRRLVAVGGQTVALTGLPREMPCTLDGRDWLTYFHFVYQYAQRTGSQLPRYAAFTDVRPGNASADGNMIE